MEYMKKIRKLNQEKAERALVMSQLILKKRRTSNEKSFFGGDKEGDRIKNQEQENRIYFIKNLDENKIEVIDDDEKAEKLLSDLDLLPETEKIMQKIWMTYTSDYEKQQEIFLEACYQGNVPMVQKVISSKSKHPIDPKISTTDDGQNGVHLATVSGSYRNVEIIQVLLKVGVDINGRTINQRRTPLMLGSIRGNDLAVKTLLDLGADPNLQDYEGNTALHFACAYNQSNLIDILLTKCATDILNNKHQKPIQCISSSHETLTAPKQIFSASFNKKTEETNDSQNWIQKINQVPISEIKQIGLSSFRKLSILGKGAFGQVYLVENLQDNKKYAMKVLDKQTIMRQNILRYAMTERKILSTINHPFVVKLYYALQSSDKLYLLMQYCPGGDLLRYIKKKGRLSQNETRKYIAEIVLALEQLHRAQIIYRDLKPGNIVIDKDGHACLTDFGLSKQASVAHSFCGSTAYLAPQMIYRRGHTKVLDWYLLGVLIYESLTGRPPFWDNNREQLVANIKNGKYKKLGKQYSQQVKDLIENLLKSSSSKRLGFKGAHEIKDHPWLKDIDWLKVLNREQVMQIMQPVEGKAIKQQNFVESLKIDNTNKITGWDFANHKNLHQSV